MSWTQSLYDRLPTWLQHCAVSLYGVHWKRERFGPGHAEELAGYEAREAMPSGERDAWIDARLREILAGAAEHVPYYRDRWRAAEANAARAGRLQELPITEKDDLRGAAGAFCREDMHPRPVYRLLTSGSTGTPIETRWTKRERRRSFALREARSARWAGVSFREPRATFSGRLVVPAERTGGPFHRYNAAERQVYLSAFHLSADTASAYIAAMHRHGTRWLTGYAVSFYLLATFMLDQGLEPPPLAAVITTSEKVTPEMREVMERAYGCKVYEEYSSVENISFASECREGGLHVSPDAGIVELVRSDGSPAGPGEEGEVVATGLIRAYQPLIRFRLGDRARWAEEPCPCGRDFPLLAEVCGRIEDVVVAPDGRQLVRFHGLFIEQPHVVQAQVIQDALDHLTIRVVGTDAFGPDDELDIQARVRARLGPAVRCTVERVSAIPTTATGKYRAVISKLEKDA